MDDKKRLEESLIKIEDIKIKLETSTFDLQRKLEVENKVTVILIFFSYFVGKIRVAYKAGKVEFEKCEKRDEYEKKRN
jgi:hypothetical protein